MKYTYVLLFCLIPLLSDAQMYHTAAGIRMGDEFGYSFKQRVFNKATLEFIYADGLITGTDFAAGIFEQHYSLLGKRLNIYLGGGYFHSWTPSNVPDDGIIKNKGIPLIFGAEITIGRLNISTDVMPLYYLTGENQARFTKQSGVSLRYVFWKRKSRIAKIWDKITFWN